MNSLIRIGFMALVFVPLLTSLWYVPFRLGRLLDISRVWPLYVVVVIGVISSMFIMMAFSTAPTPLKGMIATAAGMAFFLHALLFFSLLAIDIVRLFVTLPSQASALIAIGLAVVVIVVGAWRANGYKVEQVKIPIEGLTHEVRIMHLSDIHIGGQRGQFYLQKIVNSTNELAPDIVAITGDLVDGFIALDNEVLSPLADLNAPTYYVAGNHEYYIDAGRAFEIIAGHGAEILHNKVVRSNGIQLVGLDYMNADEESFDMHAVSERTIKSELPKIPLDPDIPSLLLHHSPVGLKYVADAGVDVMLAGHTHGGQVFPATLIAPLIFERNKGLSRHDSMHVYVSQGAGTFGPRLRLGTSNEITLIELVPAS